MELKTQNPPEKTNKFWRKILRAKGWKPSVKHAVSIGGGLTLFGTIAGTLIGLNTYWEERSNLKIQVNEITLKTLIAREKAYGTLKNIETDHGQITGFRIDRLQKQAAYLDLADTDYVRSFSKSLQKAIKFFDNETVAKTSLGNIKYKDGFIIWDDCKNLEKNEDSIGFEKLNWEILTVLDENPQSKRVEDIMDPKNPLCDFFHIAKDTRAYVYFRKEEVDFIRKTPFFVDKEKIKHVFPDAFSLYSVSWKTTEDQNKINEKRKKIAAALRRVREDLYESYIGEDRIILTLTIQNKSRLPNLVLKNALLRMCGRISCKDFDLQMTDLDQKDGDQARIMSRMDGNSIQILSYYSAGLDPIKSSFVKKAIKRNYRMKVFLRDIHGKPWYGTYEARLTEMLKKDANAILPYK